MDRTLSEVLDSHSESLFTDLCYLDFRFWSERVFGAKPKDFHIEWMDLVHNNRFVMLQAHRGSGKTFFLGIIYPLWLCYFRPGSKVLLTASELGQATKILDEIKDTIEHNEFLQELMPPNPSTWKKTELKLTNGSHILCKAFTVHIKGVHVNYAFVDEIQDIHDREVFNKAISPTVDHYKGHLIAVGVPDNPGDMVEELSHRRGYVAKKYPVLISPGVPLWPEVYPMKEINRIRAQNESSFQTQYMLNPRAEREGAVFPSAWITNCFDFNERFHDKRVHDESTCILGCDFAMSAHARADYDAYVIIEKISGRTLIRFGERHKGLPKDAKLARIKDLCSRFTVSRIYCDPSGIGTAVIQELRNDGYPVFEGEFHAKARHKLLVNLQIMMQPDKLGVSQLVIPRNPDTEDSTLTFTNKLVEELTGFKEEKSQATGMISYVSKTPHDDSLCEGTSIITEYGIKNIEDIQPSTKVLTHTGMMKPVERTMSKSCVRPIITIKPYGNLKFSLTDNHKLFTLKKPTHSVRKDITFKISETNSQDIDPNKHLLLSPINREIKDKQFIDMINYFPTTDGWNYNSQYYWNYRWKSKKYKRFIPIDKHFCFFIGHYVGDGFETQIVFNKRDKKLIKIISTYLQSLGINPRHIPSPLSNSYALGFCCIPFQRFLKLHCLKKENKKLPGFTLYLAPELQKEIIKGYWSADCSLVRGRMTCHTISKNLAFQVRFLFLRNNLVCNVNEIRRHRYNIINRNQFVLEVSKYNTNLFYGKKNDRFDCGHSFIFKNYLISCIHWTSHKSGELVNVYDLQVKDDKSYCPNGIAIRNCAMALALACHGASQQRDFLDYIAIG